MSVELTWGTDAFDNGLGALQDVMGLIDWVLLDTEVVVSATASSTLLEFPGTYLGNDLLLRLEGTDLQTSDGALSGGTITTATIYNATTGSLTDNIATFEGSLDGAELRSLAIAEVLETDTAAIEDYFTSLDWVYNGSSAIDFLPEDVTSVDGILIDLAGDDVFMLLQGDDEVAVGSGNDNVRAGSGDDIIYGGDGNDQLRGSTGDDVLIGGAGDDFLSGQRDNDLLLGGDGNDRILGGGGIDDLEGGDGDDFLKPGFDDDFAVGGGGNDIVNGNAGNDFITGLHGDDTVRGGGGDDTLIAFAGDDVLKGGSGSDVFVFAPILDEVDLEGATKPNARVLDFSIGEDILVFSDLDDAEEGAVDLSMLTGTELSLAELITEYASVQSGRVVFDFGDEGTLTLNGINTTDGLVDSMAWLSDAEFL